MSYPTTPTYLMTELEFQQSTTVQSLKYSAEKMRQHAERQAEKWRRAAQQLDLMAVLVEGDIDNTATGQAWLEATELILDEGR